MLINVTKTVVCRIIHENVTLRVTLLFLSRRDLNTQPPDLESGALPLRHEILSYNLIYIILLAEVQSFSRSSRSGCKIDYHPIKFSLLKVSTWVVRGFLTFSVDIFIATSLGFHTESWPAWVWSTATTNGTSSLILNQKSLVWYSIDGSVVECSPATRAARVRFPVDAFCIMHHVESTHLSFVG